MQKDRQTYTRTDVCKHNVCLTQHSTRNNYSNNNYYYYYYYYYNNNNYNKMHVSAIIAHILVMTLTFDL